LGLKSEGEQNQIIMQFSHFAGRIAAEFRGSKEIPFEDLCQQGMLGLVEAVRKYDDERHVNLESFVAASIRYSILHFVQEWNQLDHIDLLSEADENRIFEWQIWGHLPTEYWKKLACRPDRLRELYEEIAEKDEALAAAMLSLKPIDRKMVWAFYMRDPPADLGQVAREFKMPYSRTGKRIARAVRKLRTIVRAIELKQAA
jgi:RNA polymerase sigma factor (sigma-70 family)